MATRLIFPEEILTQHLVVLGKTGAGKSSALRHIVEHLLSQKKRVCIIDPKGDWNGLKVSADGKGPGFPVILFGDFKETAGKPIPPDVPLNEYSGKHIAELVTSGNRPCVVGLRGWTQGGMHKFWTDFASSLFNAKGGEFYLVVDEVHNFAPKGKVMSPDVGMSLHWTNRLINEGRGLGLINLIASQRPQKVHNDTLDACETLVAMRIAHPAARASVEEWLQGAGSKEVAREILNNLAGMKRGEAYVWSPEAGFGPERIMFPMFTTFDSFAPPQLQTKVSTKDWGSVDLEVVKEKLASVIEKEKANDPKEIRKKYEAQITELKKQLNTKTPASTKTVETIKEVEKPILKDAQIKRMETVTQKLIKADDRLFDFLQEFNLKLRSELGNAARDIAVSLQKLRTNGHKSAVPTSSQIPRALPRRAVPSVQAPHSNGDVTGITGGAFRILQVLASKPELKLTKPQLGTLAKMKHTGGSFGTYMSRLRSAGLVVDDGKYVQISEAGIEHIGADRLPEPLSSEEVLQQWLNTPAISGGAAKMLETLFRLRRSGEGLSRADLAKAVDMEASGGSFGTYLSRLRSNGLIQEDAGVIYASDTLFINEQL